MTDLATAVGAAAGAAAVAAGGTDSVDAALGAGVRTGRDAFECAVAVAVAVGSDGEGGVCAVTGHRL